MKQLLFLWGFLFYITTVSAQNLTEVDYTADNANFPNPGRGFYHADDQLNPETIADYPSEGITLILREYHIDDFRDTKIPVWYLWNIQRDLNNIRNAGLKVILRFRYTAKTSKPYGDAPLNIVLEHIKQLEPILRQNSDVIFTFQAGFIGAWGEWYYTDYFSASPGNITEQNWIDRRAVVDSLLSALPPEIMVNVRTPNYKRHLLNEESYTPVTVAEAYKNLPVARISHHNDCFLASVSDVGTYTDTTVQKPYLAEDTKYTVIGGETCGQSGYSHCENALKELKRFHWSYLNRDYHQGVIGDWIDEGCYPEIQKKLGYRYRLINGNFTSESSPDGTFLFKLNLINEGFANPSNPMKVEVILRRQSDNKEFAVQLNDDMRFWPLSDTIKLDYSFGFTQFMSAGYGSYDLFINIADAHATIKDNPAYSIRLANEGLWEPSTGYNKLNAEFTFTAEGSSQYTGGYFFNLKNREAWNPYLIIDGNDEDWSSIPPVFHNPNQNAMILKAWNNADSLFALISGNNMGAETIYFIDADNKQTTGDNGFDYKITPEKVYFFNSDNVWQEMADETPDYAVSPSGSVKEMAMAFTALNKVPLADYYGLKVKSGTDYLPGNNMPPAEVILRKINSTPLVKVQNRGNTNTVYWNRNVDDDKGAVRLYRHTVGGNNNNDTLLAVLSSGTISYQDFNVDPSKTYIYRAYYVSGNFISQRNQEEQEVTAESDKQDYLEIHLDGNFDDWKLCRPVATGMPDRSALKEVRFFNTADSLFYSFNTGNETIEDYQLYFKTDGNSGFEFKISNDSLFTYQSDGWVLKQLLLSYGSNGFLEAGLKLSAAGLDTEDYITASAFINGKDIWGKGVEFPYLKYESLPAPSGFRLKVSSEMPYHRIKISWSLNTNPDEYIIQRSVDDSLHFSTLISLDGNKSYYLDDDVDSAHVYYYRMFSRKNILRSAYTKTMWMRPGIAGINSTRFKTGKISVFPVPVTGRATVVVNLNSPDDVNVSLFTLDGQLVRTIYRGRIHDEKTVRFHTEALSPGLYFIKVKGNNTLMINKVIIR